MLRAAPGAAQVRTADAIPQWAREELLEWYFGPEPREQSELSVYYVYESQDLLLVLASSDGVRLEMHRVLCSHLGRVRLHSVDGQWREVAA